MLNKFYYVLLPIFFIFIAKQAVLAEKLPIMMADKSIKDVKNSSLMEAESQPDGTYLNSCDKDSIEWKTPFLSATCDYTKYKKGAQTFRSTLDYSKCNAGSTVSNFNGGLVCDDPSPPKGSYLQYCNQISYADGVLQANCPYRYGEKQSGPYRWGYVSLDYIKKCEPGSEVNYSTTAEYLSCAEKKKELTPLEFENTVRAQLWIEHNKEKGFGEHKLEIINNSKLALSMTPQFKKALPDNGQLTADIPPKEITLAPGEKTQYSYTVGVKPDFNSMPALLYELQVTDVNYSQNTTSINLAIAPEVSISDFITILLAEQSEQERQHNEISCQQIPVDYLDSKAYPILCHSRKLSGVNVVRYVPLTVRPIPPFENWQVQNFIDNGGLKHIYQQIGILNHTSLPLKQVIRFAKQCSINSGCSPKYNEPIPDYIPPVPPPPFFNPFFGLIPLIGSLIEYSH